MRDNQIKRVLFLLEMTSELLSDTLNHNEKWQAWNEVYKEKGSWRAGDSPEKPTHAELKRVMLVLRQETIKLDKMCKY